MQHMQESKENQSSLPIDLYRKVKSLLLCGEKKKT